MPDSCLVSCDRFDDTAFFLCGHPLSLEWAIEECGAVSSSAGGTESKIGSKLSIPIDLETSGNFRNDD